MLGKVLDPHSKMLIALQDTETHLQRRRPWQRAFTPAAIKEYEAQLSKRTSQLVARLEAQRGEVRLDQWFDYFTCVAETVAVLFGRGWC